MSTGEGSPKNEWESREEYAIAWFNDIFPDAVVDFDVSDINPQHVSNLLAAGFGLVRLKLVDQDELQLATYMFEETEFTKTIARIYDLEESNVLPKGSHTSAIDHIADGTFLDRWQHLMGDWRN